MDDLWSVSNNVPVSKSRYVCGIDGCTKSYASRQNRFRHRSKDHPTQKSPCATPKRARCPAVPSQTSGQTAHLEEFSALCDPCTEEATTSFGTSHKPVPDNLAAIIIDHETLHHSTALNDPLFYMDEPLLTSHGQTMTQIDDEQSLVVKACMDIAQRGTPESIAFLRRMGHVMITIAKYADNADPRSSNQMGLLREVVDTLCASNNTFRQDDFAASLMRKQSVSSGFSPIPTDVSSTISQSDDLEYATSSSEQPPASPAGATAIPSSIYSGSSHGFYKRMRTDPAAIQLATASLDLNRHCYDNNTVDSCSFNW